MYWRRNQPAMWDFSGSWLRPTRESGPCKATILKTTWEILRGRSPATKRRLNSESRSAPPRTTGTTGWRWPKAIASWAPSSGPMAIRGARAIAVSESLNREQPSNVKILHELGFDYEVSGRTGYPGDRSGNQKVIDDYRRALVFGEILLKLQRSEER